MLVDMGFEQVGALDLTRYAAPSSRVGQPLGITQVETGHQLLHFRNDFTRSRTLILCIKTPSPITGDSGGKRKGCAPRED
jgi:hypothetical protein